MKIGFVIAMESEAMPFLGLLGKCEERQILGDRFFFSVNYPELVVSISGIGEIQAAAAATALIMRFGVERIVNFGFVGYYGNDLPAGELLNITGVIHCDFDFTLGGYLPGQYAGFDSPVWKADDTFFGRYGFRTALLSSCDRFLDDGEERDKCVRIFGKNAADMEGAGIAVVCRKAGVPCSFLKCISNNLDQTFEDFKAFSEQGINECARIVFETVCRSSTLQEE